MIVEYKNIPIYFNDQGSGEVIVLLHGFLENSSMWNDLIPVISKTKRTISIDLLGHGQTGCLGYIHTMEAMAETVHVVLKHLKIKNVTLIGHSMGGYVVLAYTELFPNMVSGICLVNSSALADTEERKLNRDRAVLAVKQNHKAFIGMSISNLFAPENREKFQDEIEEVKKKAFKTPLQGILAALEGMKIRKNREFVLNNDFIKKMMIIGHQDPILEYEKLKEQTKGKSINIAEFSGGHMSHIENKSELTYEILHFIEK